MACSFISCKENLGKQAPARREPGNAIAGLCAALTDARSKGSSGWLFFFIFFLLTKLLVTAAEIDTFQCAHSCAALPQVRYAGCCHMQLRCAGHHHMLLLKQACLDQPVTLVPEPAGQDTAML